MAYKFGLGMDIYVCMYVCMIKMQCEEREDYKCKP